MEQHEIQAQLDPRGFYAGRFIGFSRSWPEVGRPRSEDFAALDFPDLAISDCMTAQVLEAFEHVHAVTDSNTLRPSSRICWQVWNAIERVRIFERWHSHEYDSRLLCVLHVRGSAVLDVEIVLWPTTPNSRLHGPDIAKAACECAMRLTRKDSFEFDPVLFADTVGDRKAYRRARRVTGIVPAGAR